MRDAILIGVVLASLIMVLFLRDWGTSMVAVLVIPATVLITFIALKVLDQSFNLMTLGGLAAAVGLVIDDAIVVVENVALHRDAGQGRLQAIQSALREITVPLVGSTITPIVVFLPLIAITGVTGVFFRALAVTVGASLLTSLALALTWTPTLSQYFIRGTHAEADSRALISPSRRNCWPPRKPPSPAGFRQVVDFYERWLRFGLERPRWMAVFAVVLIAVSSLAYKALGDRPAAGDGRRRLHPRLPHPAGDLAAGNQSHGQPRGANAARDPGGRELLRGARACSWAWRPSPKRIAATSR